MHILIATVTAGAGHLAAAAALDETWRAFRPGDVVERLDLVKFFSPLHRKIVSDGYVKIVEHAPEIWGLMFGKTDNLKVAERFNRLKRVFPSKSRGLFGKYVKQFGADVVLCTHYLPLETLSQMRSRAQKDKRTPPVSPLVVSIVTDFEAHALWMDPCVDLYCVAAEETKARLVARGAPPQNILATGIPISGKFALRPEPKAVRQALGLRDDQPIILVLSGGFGMGPVGAILAELDKVPRPFQVVAVTGRNQELRRELAVRDFKHPTRVLGYASNMHELMAVADLIISKPGGLTTSEVLAMGRPLFIVNPIPGQEAANSDFLLEHGAAAKVNRVEDLPFKLDQLLGSRKLVEMARAARNLGRPTAARQICEEVLKRAQARSQPLLAPAA
jgi:processive 1,2-diacylglycerol beta-glucosyltransferase